MALFQENYLTNLASQRLKGDRRYDAYSSEDAHDYIRKSLLLESSVNFSAGKHAFDIFLSHSYSDKELILGIKIELENFGYSVYVDWIEDYSMDRTNVIKDNVIWIKDRMKTSKCLLYATSTNSSSSKWMPWELGFMDGFKQKVAILPIAVDKADSFSGVEYLSVYPYMDKSLSRAGDMELWVFDQEDRNFYQNFRNWLNGKELEYHNI
jgi:hypothetical protein